MTKDEFLTALAALIRTAEGTRDEVPVGVAVHWHDALDDEGETLTWNGERFLRDDEWERAT